MSDIIIKSGTYQKATKSEKDRVGGFSLFKKINEYLGLSDPCCPKNVVVTSLKGSDTNETFVGFIPTAAQNNITAGTGGAISVTNYFTTINTDAGGDAFTLADGTQVGQLKCIRLVVDGGGNAVITPANLAAGTTITMDDASDEVELIWNGTDWVVIKNIGATVA